MSSGLRAGRRSRKHRLRRTVAKWVIALSLIAAAGLYAYRTGSRLSEMKIDALRGQIEALSATVNELQAVNAEHQRAIANERALADQWRRKYQQEIPTGANRQLYDVILRKLADGVSSERLEFVISAAQERHACEPQPTSKRFLVTTPLQRGGNNTAVTFGRGEITMTASGAAGADANGNPEAWFDPAQPVTVRLVPLTGEPTEAEGLLPLYPSVVVGDAAYHFSVIAGPRGFVETSGEKCKYP
jgi:hypothetical protein